jgi:hypothetical protein
MVYQKLIVSHLLKTFDVVNVSEECFNNSDKIESAGLMDCFKIFSLEELNFRINELKRLNYKEDIN